MAAEEGAERRAQGAELGPGYTADCERCGAEAVVALRWWVRGRSILWCVTCSKLVLAGTLPADPSEPLRYPLKEEG